MNLFDALSTITHRPDVWSKYTAGQLWADPYVATQMLNFHLNQDVDLASRSERFIDESVAWLNTKFGLNEDTKVIDFGCGPGLYTSRFAQCGAEVTGVDFSANSIDYAKQYAEEHGLSITYVEQNYLEFETEAEFDLVTMIMCDFCALSPQQRGLLLKKWKRMLAADGSIVFDVYTDKAFAHRKESETYERNLMNHFWAPDDYFGFINVFKYIEEKVKLDKYTIVLPDETRVIYNWLQFFTLEALSEEVEAHGLRIDSVYNDVRGEEYTGSDEMAVVLRSA
ncbi:class I SAM-dependent methyltransferase [Halodesulfovibrio marinisediminis]|uniref:Methyltransferase domain-containing protein n=1 Tax=Halodesulfovibrio marinisediminis DSM 17456 TaxID=1121457 RepID=A0A1N6DHH4_9BACT|nr:class I SAM-dependent methyltransferase [Halodesulfovibrio marinisediminis]SIN70218.1 Methyltransferase domain-containing protein [Halodesulfovibrio marinisediminis DSM 17456]